MCFLLWIAVQNPWKPPAPGNLSFLAQGSGERGRGVGGRRTATPSPAGLSGVTLRQHWTLEREPLVFCAPTPPPSAHSAPRRGAFDARRSSKNRTFQAQARGDSLLFRNGDIRASLPLCPGTRRGPVEVPFDLMSQPQREKFSENSWWGAWAKAPGRRIQNANAPRWGPEAASPQGWSQRAPTWLPQVAPEPLPPVSTREHRHPHL